MQFGKLKRRDFITLLGGAAAAWPLAARGQFAGTLKVGMVAAGSQSSLAPNVLGFRQRLSNLGYREGNNLTFEFAHATDVEDFARGYREMVARKVDILVATGVRSQDRQGPRPDRAGYDSRPRRRGDRVRRREFITWFC